MVLIILLCSLSNRPHHGSCPSVRPSVRPSVCSPVPYGLLTRIQQGIEKTKIGVNVPQDRSNRFADF